jgi:hypothetical protein
MAQRGRPRKTPKDTTTGKSDKSQDKEESPEAIKAYFDEFAKAVASSGNSNMIDMMNSGLLSPYLLNDLLKWSEGTPYEYTRDEVVKLLKNPVKNEKAIRNMHLYFYHNNLFYKRIVTYFTSMLTFKHYEKPLILDESEITTSTFKRSYAKVRRFFNKFTVEEELRAVMETVVGQDVGYYYVMESQQKITLKKLPTDWCMLTGKTDYGYKFQFNMVYFLRPGADLIDTYPQEFIDDFNSLFSGDDAASNKNEPYLWHEVTVENSIVFKFNDSISTVIPVFSGLFLDLLEIVEYKNMIKSKAQMDCSTILFQQIPLRTDKDANKNDAYMISGTDAGKFHQALKTSLPQAGEGTFRAITSPCSISAVDLKHSDNKDSLVGTAESAFYNSSGVSELLFNSGGTSGMALLKAIGVDETLIFHMLRQFERFLTREVNKTTGKVKFKVNMPDLTYYNTADKLTQYISAGTNGIPNKSLILNAVGIDQVDAPIMKSFDSFLGFDDWMPLLNSNVMSGGNPNDKGGAPSKGDKVTDSTAKGQDLSENLNRNLGKK